MRAVRAKKILTQARKNGRTGKVDIQTEYDRLKKVHKSHTQTVNTKSTRRQERRKGLVVYGMEGKFSPKPKAHKWRQPIVKNIKNKK